jgi:UPF0716 protein FxsA
MAGKLLLIFIVVPLVETWLLIKIGSVIGALTTIALVVLTAVVGSQLVRHQGLKALADIQRCQQRGEMPAVPLLEGAALLLAGAFLITPGFITDTLGFALLVPALRQAAAQQLLARAVTVQAGPAWQHRASNRADGPRQQRTIEGEYSRDDTGDRRDQ